LSLLDPFDLARFEQAQASVFAQAIAELRAGRKRSHWMWFVFPQYRGLGSSPMSQRFAIRSLDEARAYLAHPVLGPRLRECTSAVIEVEGRSAHDIFGSPDDLKLRSCATLFAAVSPAGSEWARLLDKYFDGQPDYATLELLREPA
jgi:uncharacterized protein (DUF1810 family)